MGRGACELAVATVCKAAALHLAGGAPALCGRPPASLSLGLAHCRPLRSQAPLLMHRAYYGGAFHPAVPQHAAVCTGPTHGPPLCLDACTSNATLLWPAVRLWTRRAGAAAAAASHFLAPLGPPPFLVAGGISCEASLHLDITAISHKVCTLIVTSPALVVPQAGRGVPSTGGRTQRGAVFLVRRRCNHHMLPFASDCLTASTSGQLPA